MTNALALVVIDAVVWVVLSLVWGTALGFLPATWLQRDSWWTRQRRWERNGELYRRLGVQRWKDALPESNRLGPGDRQSKRHLPPLDQFGILVAETRRAEYVHVAIAVSGVVFVAWNPPWLAAIMVVFGVVFNLVFIIVQRYNRLRLQRVVARRRDGSGPRGENRSRPDE